MRNSIVATVLGVIILFIALIVLPSYYMGIIHWRNDMNTCQTTARNFIDMVIDNGQITDRSLSDLNLSLAGCHSTFTYEYYREERVTNPDPNNPGEVIVEWVHTDVDENTEWHSGDLVTIVITQQSQGLFQKLSSMLLGSSYNNIEIRLTGMVR